jgi:hypothetical protein
MSRRSVSSCVSPGPRSPDAAFLALEVGPAADEARGHVLELRELHLELAFGAARALREDVEDQGDAVDDPALQRELEIALLHAGQDVVEDDEVGAAGAAQGRDLLDLALAGEQRGIRARAASADFADHACAGGVRQRGDLGKALRAVAATEVERDEQRALLRRLRLRVRDWARDAAMATGRDGTTVEIACLYTICVTVFLSRTTY